MREVIRNVVLMAVTAIMYILLQIVASIAQFALFGSGNTSAKYSNTVSLFFVLFEAVLLIVLFYKKRVMANTLTLLLNLAVLTGLYNYFVLYMSSTF